MGKKEIELTDLGIQDTLGMSVQERLQLLANLVVDAISEDQVSTHETGLSNAD